MICESVRDQEGSGIGARNDAHAGSDEEEENTGGEGARARRQRAPEDASGSDPAGVNRLLRDVPSGVPPDQVPRRVDHDQKPVPARGHARPVVLRQERLRG